MSKKTDKLLLNPKTIKFTDSEGKEVDIPVSQIMNGHLANLMLVELDNIDNSLNRGTESKEINKYLGYFKKGYRPVDSVIGQVVDGKFLSVEGGHTMEAVKLFNNQAAKSAKIKYAFCTPIADGDLEYVLKTSIKRRKFNMIDTGRRLREGLADFLDDLNANLLKSGFYCLSRKQGESILKDVSSLTRFVLMINKDNKCGQAVDGLWEGINTYTDDEILHTVNKLQAVIRAIKDLPYFKGRTFSPNLYFMLTVFASEHTASEVKKLFSIPNFRLIDELPKTRTLGAVRRSYYQQMELIKEISAPRTTPGKSTMSIFGHSVPVSVQA